MRSESGRANPALLALVLSAVLAVVVLYQYLQIQDLRQQLTSANGEPPYLHDKLNQPAALESCNAHLKHIDGAIQQWAIENKLEQDAVVLPDQIKLYLKDNQIPTCPRGGTYKFGKVRDNPWCSFPGHTL